MFRMSTLSRATAKALLKSLNLYETQKEMVEKAVDPVKPTLVKSHARNRIKLESSFTDLSLDWKTFKADLDLPETAFNEKEEGIPKYQYNDAWFEKTKLDYFELLEKSDDKLEDIEKPAKDDSDKKEEKFKTQKAQQDERLATTLYNQIVSVTENITTSIDNISSEVRRMDDGGEGVARVLSLKSDLNNLDNKIDEVLSKLYSQYICAVGDTEVQEKEATRALYIKTEKIKISGILMMLSKKAKEPDKPASLTSTVGSGGGSKEHTYLKKADPPKWFGDPLDFADFKRKWVNQVSSAKMPPETELDRLRENIPAQAAKALFGETIMAKAWKLLESLYGDKDLIANKLKQQLKNMKVRGKQDYDIVIDLVTDVKNIVLRLQAIGAEGMLHVDNEFLSAIFRILPNSSQTKWLDFDKSMDKSKWAALMRFMEVAREQALQTKVLMAGYEKSESEAACHKCGKTGHKAKKCTEVKANSANVSVDRKDEEDRNKKDKKKAKEECGRCPICKDRHTYLRLKDKEEWPSDRLFKCEKFKNMSVRDRASTLEKLNCCPKCTSWNHRKADCKSPAKCGIFISGQKCDGDHSSLVCGSGNAYCGSLRGFVVNSDSSSSSSSDASTVSSSMSSVSSSSESDSESTLDLSGLGDAPPDIYAETLLLFQDVNVQGASEPAYVCWDNGSTRCLVTHDFARRCAMRGHAIVYRLDVVGQKGDSQDSCYYVFDLVKNDGTSKRVWAYGLEKIMEPSEPADLSPVRELFPHVPAEVFASKPRKEVDILMGNNFLGLHPNGGTGRDAIDDLVALQSNFGLGWVIAGSHPKLLPGTHLLSPSALHLARINKCVVAPELLPSFWEGECLGVQSPKRCGRCLRCKDCTDPALVHSRKDQDDLEMIRRGVKLENGKLQVSYHFSRDPHCLPNNRSTVIKMAQRQESKLLRTGKFEAYSKEIQKYIDRGGVVKLSKKEMDEWKGPVNYISHHGVEQDSATTPLRVVTNSSLNNGGRSLNDCLPTGPNSLNPMLDITLRFRCHEAGLVFDLTKAYNSLHTGPVERHLRRFVYRFDPAGEWEDFAFDVVAFGDNPAANLLETGRDMVADAGKHIDPVASNKLKKDSYVDDNIGGGTFGDVKRMMGVRKPDGSYTGTMSQILEIGKLKAKVYIPTDETDEAMKELIGNKVLGYHWNATTDMMGVIVKIYLTNKRKKPRTQPQLTKETLGLLDSAVFTRRVCLGITNGFLDFLGIACPFTLRFKLLMRQLYEAEYRQLSWEEKVPGEIATTWMELIAEAVMAECIFFPRCVRPKDAVGYPLVASFGDGAFPAYAGSVYLQWQMKCVHGLEECDEDYDASLLIAKARVTPLNGYTIPRSELSGTVLQSRLSLTTVKALQSEPSMIPKGVVQMSDSKCSISAVDTTTRVLKPFFHNRVAEIVDIMAVMRKYCQVEDLQYVSGELNPADLATRGNVKVEDLGPNSFWQKGPAFLCSRRDLWPITREFARNEVPDDEVRQSGKPVLVACMRAFAVDIQAGNTADDQPTPPLLWSAIMRVMNYSDSIVKVTGILARLVKGWSMKSKSQALSKETIGDSSPEEIRTAERLLLLSAMPDTATAAKAGRLTSLCPEKEGSIIVTRGRIGEKSLSRLLGVPYLPILMPSSRAAVLFMIQAHRGEFGTVHNSVAETLARSRQKVWILRGRDLSKKVCSECYQCRRDNKVLAEQQMSRLKEESLTVCRPFTYISLDFAGPILVKGAVNARATKKCWMLVYCCRSTKAVVILPTCGYDTQSFLLRHEEFVARHGAPQSIVSDRGTQLVSAGIVLAKKSSKSDQDTPDKWNWAQITKQNQVTNWHFVPIGSPHFNGLPESTVKVLKKTLKLSLHPGVVLSYPELQTLLAKISYTVNSRPLGLGNVSSSSQQEDTMLPITPNMMLLARSSNLSPPMEYSADDRFCTRLAYVAQVEKEWWDRWIKVVLPTLFSFKKWKVRKENMKVGELVMLRYPKQFKDDYCLAKVSQIHPDSDGLVRKVTISYRKKNPREPADVYRSRPLISEQVAIHRLHRLELADETMLMDVDKMESAGDGVKQVDDSAGGDVLNEVIEEASDASSEI